MRPGRKRRQTIFYSNYNINFLVDKYENFPYHVTCILLEEFFDIYQLYLINRFQIRPHKLYYPHIFFNPFPPVPTIFNLTIYIDDNKFKKYISVIERYIIL